MAIPPAASRDYTLFSSSAHDAMGDRLTRNEKKILPHIGLLLALLVILWVVFAPGRGMLALHRANGEIERLQAENKRMAEENRILQEEIKRLQSDPAFLEEKARKEYGLLKENEILYIFKK